MFTLDSVPCADTFPADGSSGGAQIIAANGSSGGFAAIIDNDVYVQVAYSPPDGRGGVTGLLEWTPPVHFAPGNVLLAAGTRGIRFRNYTAGDVAIVSAGLSEPAEPPLQPTSAGVSTPAGSSVITYRKSTPKAVNTTVVATDLLNGEIAIAAGVLGTQGVARLTAWGDYLNNSGGAVVHPRFQLVFGGTTFLDTSTPGGGSNSSATRMAWKIEAEIMNLSSASSQLVALVGHLIENARPAGAVVASFTVGDGFYAQNTTANPDVVTMNGGNSGLAVNTAIVQPLALNVINGSASANYETRLLGALVEII